MKTDTGMARDLAKHLDQRIEIALRDFMDRCDIGGVDYDDATAKAMTVLGHYFIIAGIGIEATEHEIVETCLWHYKNMKKRIDT